MEVESIGAADRLLGELPGGSALLDVERLLAEGLDGVGAALEDVDRTRPMALALTLDPARPRPTLVLPVHQPDQFQRSLRLAPSLATPRLAPGYIGLPLGTQYPASRGTGLLRHSLGPATANMVLRVGPVREQLAAALEGVLTGGAETGEAPSEDDAPSEEAAPRSEG